jgi:hypothetical protein
MKIFRKLKEWSLNQEFNQAVEHDTCTPEAVRAKLAEQGYEYKTDYFTGIHPMGAAFVAVTRVSSFKGTPLNSDPQLAKRYEQERVKLVHEHFKKPYQAPGQ